MQGQGPIPATSSRFPPVVTKQLSTSVPQRRASRVQADRRIAESNRRINRAFFEIVSRRPFGLIRVGEIARKAGVGRATFYAHYASKEAILRAQFERMVGPLLKPLPGSACPIDATGFLAHVRDMPAIFRNLMLSPDSGAAPKLLRSVLEALLGRLLGEGRCRRDPYLPRFVAVTLLGLIETWMETGLKDPDWRMQALFRRLVESGLS